MNSHFFLASGNDQHYPQKSVARTTVNTCSQEINDRKKSTAGDRDLRTDALKSVHEGDYREAIALFSQLIHRHPEHAIDYNNRGLVYFQFGERQKALLDYNTAIELNPNLASAYNNRANYYAACGELEAAIKDYDRALDLNPSYARAWINRAITLRDLGQYDEAIDNLEVALLFEQYEGHILAERGRTHHLSGDWNYAQADYRRALAILPLSSKHRDGAGWRLRLQVENWLGELLCP